MNFRLATENDLEEICSLIKEAIIEMEKKKIFQWDEIYPSRDDFLKDIKTSTLFIGEIQFEDTKRICVVYALNKLCDEEYKKAKWKWEGDYRVIHRLCVHPDFQNRGIAKETIKHIEKEVKSIGVNCLRLDVFSKNPISLRLYQKQHFYKTGEALWRKGLFYLMEKIL